MVLSANWAYVKDACRMQKYEDIKSKEEQELHDIHSTRSKERLNAYTEIRFSVPYHAKALVFH